MCNLSKGIEEKGIEKGIEKGEMNALLFSARNMVQKMGISAEQAMAVLDIPDSDRPKFLEQLAGQ